MSSYFDQVERAMCEVVERRAHRPWYVRILGVRRTRTLTVVLAALVVAMPAVAAATNWFGLGSPDHFPGQSPTRNAGRALPSTGELLPLRIPDPQGGPPWGMRTVHTTRGDVCMQVGRVENGKLGSMGIDHAWKDDHLFHPFPNTSKGYECGTTDAAGNAFFNVSETGMSASANPTAGAKGPQASSCRSPVEPLRLPGGSSARQPAAVRRAIRNAKRRQRAIPQCSQGSTRILFMGLLGPDATAITYEAPNGSLKTQRTSGGDGAYLLVFPLNRATCNRYTHSQFGGYGPCGGTESIGGPSPGLVGAVKAITYRDGHVCNLVPPAKLQAAYNAYTNRLASEHPHRPHLGRGGLSKARILAYQRQMQPFLEAHHLTLTRLNSLMRPYCPPVGYVAPKQKRITRAEVATPISVNVDPKTKWGPRVVISFIARRPVTSSHSWYEDWITTPPGCSSAGITAGQIDLGNVRARQRLHDTVYPSNQACKGTYHGIVGYMQNSGPINQQASGGGKPGRDGSIVVGRFSFTIH